MTKTSCRFLLPKVHRQDSLKIKKFMKMFNSLCKTIEMLNSIFTFHIVFVVTSFLITNTFVGYVALKELLMDASESPHLVVGAAAYVICHYFIKTFIAHVGRSTTNEAEHSAKIISTALATIEFEEKIKFDLNFLLIQMQSRHKTVETVFFVINWNFIVGVSFCLEVLVDKNNEIILGGINVSDLFNHNMSI